MWTYVVITIERHAMPLACFFKYRSIKLCTAKSVCGLVLVLNWNTHEGNILRNHNASISYKNWDIGKDQMMQRPSQADIDDKIMEQICQPLFWFAPIPSLHKLLSIFLDNIVKHLLGTLSPWHPRDFDVDVLI